MPEGNYLKKARKNFYLSEDVRYFIDRLAKYLGISEGAVIERAVRRYHIKKLGPYKWDDPLDPRPRNESFKIRK
mgnify:CR=1 FL=1